MTEIQSQLAKLLGQHCSSSFGLRRWHEAEQQDSRCQLWLAEARGTADRWVLKRFASRRSFEQATAALKSWPQLHRELAEAMPVLEAEDPGLRVIVLRYLRSLPVSGDTQLRMQHRLAGRWLATLHTSPLVDDDSVHLAEAYRRRWSTLQAATDRLDEETRAGFQNISTAHDFSKLMSTFHRVRCHRDFRPGNWLNAPSQRLYVLDFEHARSDLALSDLVQLASECWLDRPDLEAEFMHGYGHDPRAGHEQLWSALLNLHGAHTLLWGLRHHSPRFVELGRRIITSSSEL